MKLNKPPALAKRKRPILAAKTLVLVSLFIWVMGILGISVPVRIQAVAQTSNEAWDPPINLSHSGSSTNPNIVIDSNQRVHVIWEDTFSGLIHTQFKDDQWSSPEVISPPFGDAVPKLIPDSQGRIHAFWIDTTGQLFYSRVLSANLGDPNSWGQPQLITASVISFDVALGAKNSLHLSFVRTVDSTDYPAGIYYIHSSDFGLSWNLPVALYRSPYFRSLTAENANVKIAVPGSQYYSNIYVTWDNRPRRQVLFTKSNDEGRTWDSPVEIDRPSNQNGFATPLNLQVGAAGQQLLLAWQTGEPGTNCSHFFQWSPDFGNIWSEKQPMLGSLTGCSQESRLFPFGDNLLLLYTILQGQVYLSAWDGIQWSQPHAQRELSAFEDPETYMQVTLGCLRAALSGDDRLYVVGCDQIEGGDIWLTSRALGPAEEWFPPPSIWNPPTTITSNVVEIQSPLLIAGPEQRLHVFWTQPEDTTTPSLQTAIFYAGWDGQNWTRPISILRSPQGNARQSTVKLAPDGRLLAAWSGDDPGEIYFSWANATRAYSPMEWPSPVVLPAPRTGARSPDILVESSGRITIAYALPLNEGRGVYLTQSTDQGQTWSAPLRIFDAAAAGWEMVDQPLLANTTDGRLHAIWTRNSLPGGKGSLGIYYSNSTDGGKTWSEAKDITERPVAWSQMLGFAGSTVHVAWQETTGGRQVVENQLSQDSGATWNNPASLMLPGENPGKVSLASDSAGQLHLLQAAQDYAGKLTLRRWLWDGSRWASAETLELDNTAGLSINTLSAAISLDGRLGMVYSASVVQDQRTGLQNALFFTSRLLELPTELPTQPAPDISTPTFLPGQSTTPEPAVTPTSAPTPTLNPAVLNQAAPSFPFGLPLNNKWAGAIVSGGLCVAIVAVYSILQVRRIRNREK